MEQKGNHEAGFLPLSSAEAPAAAAETLVPVLLPVAIGGAYSYRVPPGLSAPPGSIVAVPLGTRTALGVVWDPGREGSVEAKRLRPIEAVLPAPPLNADLRRFVDWVADYTLSPPGMVLRMALRVPRALEPEKPAAAVRLAGPPPEKLTAARRRVLDLVADNLAWSRTGLAGAAGVSIGVVDGLLAAGTLEWVEVPPRPPAAIPDPEHRGPELSPEQATAAAGLRADMAKGAFAVTLIDGVTGSGKTEVYFEAVAECLRRGRQALILLPEIALTGEFLERFALRFGAPPAEWHSAAPPRQRERVWRGIADGSVRAVVGARSALFLPFADLGLIVVDEEHDPAYKQDDGVTYNARDMAVARGHLGGFPVILSSATPSIESRANADAGRYRRIALPNRFKAAALPSIVTVDLRRHPPPRGAWLSPPLSAAIAETLARKEQTLLFLNRRGYAPLTVCRACGHRYRCPNCSAWLVEHRFRGVLACHHCGHTERKASACVACGVADNLAACGPGVERLAEEVGAAFPDARCTVLSSDLGGGTERLRRELAAVAAGETDIVIGTQLVAKGHNFPLLTLVGVVDADLGLDNGDLRAAERTFQVLSQVTGRAGRSGAASRALVQTYAPDHPVLKAIAAGDRESFYAREIAARREAELPPFTRLAALIASGADRGEVESFAKALRRAAPPDDRVLVLGPTEAPLALIRGRHRLRLLVRAPRAFNLQAWLRDWLTRAPRQRGSLRLQIDIDPQSFL